MAQPYFLLLSMLELSSMLVIFVYNEHLHYRSQMVIDRCSCCRKLLFRFSL